MLINSDQERVYDYLQDQITYFCQKALPSYVSVTFVPFYDMTISAEQKKLLGEIKLHEIVKEKVNL